MVADTYALAPYFDTFLYVLRLGYSQQEQLRLIDEVSRLRKLRHPLVVLNDGRV